MVVVAVVRELVPASNSLVSGKFTGKIPQNEVAIGRDGCGFPTFSPSAPCLRGEMEQGIFHGRAGKLATPAESLRPDERTWCYRCANENIIPKKQ
jgi:hypothetical protein